MRRCTSIVWLAVVLLMTLSACVSAFSTNKEVVPTMTATNSSAEEVSPLPPAPLTRELTTGDYVIEVVDFLPYSDEGIRAVPLPSSMMRDSKTSILGWAPPAVVPSTDGATWLATKSGFLRVADHIIRLWPERGSETETEIGMLLLPDGLLVARQNADTLTGVLYRFDSHQNLLWTRALNFTERVEVFDAFPRLLADRDGSVYFYTGQEGQVLKIDLANGSLEHVYRFAEGEEPLNLWMLDHKLYWYRYDPDTTLFSWNEYDLTLQKYHVVLDPPLQSDLAAAEFPLPDGGALIYNGWNLIWMNRDGTERQRIVVDQLQPILWNQHTITPRFTSLYPQADGTYIFPWGQEEGAYILRLRLTP